MVSSVTKILKRMQSSPAGVRFRDLEQVCDYYFERRPSSGSGHITYKTPWPGESRVNIQNRNGEAKPYQVRQVLAAIEKLNEQKGNES